MKKYLLLILVFYCFSCNPKLQFEEYKHIPDEEWCINHPVRFNIDVTESGTYKLYAGIRHTTDYEMANLWCFINVSDSARVILRDTLNIKLAEPDGRWLGEGYTIKTLEKELNKSSFLSKGKYTCEIQQGMRIKCLKGIKNIGFIIQKTEALPTHGQE